MTYTYGWDLGGAHVKRVLLNERGNVESADQVACPLWRGIHHLRDALGQLSADASASKHAITMTGELVDLFGNRAEGVAEILRVFAETVPTRDSHVFCGDGFIDPEHANAQWQRAASANWRATALLAAMSLPHALVLDIGSTTTDITLIRNGKIVDRGYDDRTRLSNETLVYTGVVRSPLMSIAPRVPFEGAWVGVASELFATTGDVYRITEQLPEQFDHADTADGQPKTGAASMRRLARMIGCDADQFPENAWRRLARWYAARQADTIRLACDRQLSQIVVDDDVAVVGLGVGSFLAESVAQLLGLRCLDFAVVTAMPGIASRNLLPAINVCGPAFAVARLLHLARV